MQADHLEATFWVSTLLKTAIVFTEYVQSSKWTTEGGWIS